VKVVLEEVESARCPSPEVWIQLTNSKGRWLGSSLVGGALIGSGCWFI